MRTTTYLLLLVLCFATGCKKYIDVNNDPNNPTTVQEALILAPVELNLSSVLTGGATFNSTGMAAILANHYMQNIALNQPVPNEGTYQLFNVNVDDSWKSIYVVGQGSPERSLRAHHEKKKKNKLNTHPPFALNLPKGVTKSFASTSMRNLFFNMTFHPICLQL